MQRLRRSGILMKNRLSTTLKSYCGLDSVVDNMPSKCARDVGFASFSSAPTGKVAINDFVKRFICDDPFYENSQNLSFKTELSSVDFHFVEVIGTRFMFSPEKWVEMAQCADGEMVIGEDDHSNILGHEINPLWRF